MSHLISRRYQIKTNKKIDNEQNERSYEGLYVKRYNTNRNNIFINS